MMQNLQSENGDIRTAAEITFRHLVGALMAAGASAFAGAGSGLWSDLVARITSQ